MERISELQGLEETSQQGCEPPLSAGSTQAVPRVRCSVGCLWPAALPTETEVWSAAPQGIGVEKPNYKCDCHDVHSQRHWVIPASPAPPKTCVRVPSKPGNVLSATFHLSPLLCRLWLLPGCWGARAGWRGSARSCAQPDSGLRQEEVQPRKQFSFPCASSGLGI